MLKLAVIGDPVGHSKSPALHAQFLREAAVSGTYEAIRVPAGACAREVERLRNEGYLGLNVTTPLKEEAHALCGVDALDDVAKATGSVNTLTLLAEGVFGANTDGVGSLTAVQEALGADVAGKRLLVLGVGPTARVAAYVLRARGAEVMVWNRTRERAYDFARALGISVWEDGRKVDLAFSTLPPNADLSDALVRALRDAPMVIDANYGPRATLGGVLDRAVIDGEGMLLAQARASFMIWRSALTDLP